MGWGPADFIIILSTVRLFERSTCNWVSTFDKNYLQKVSQMESESKLLLVGK